MTPPPDRPNPTESPAPLDLTQVRPWVARLFADDLHAKRVESLANGAAGTLHAATLSIHAIGQAYAQLAGIAAKHGVKQVDRFLSNKAIVVPELAVPWCAFVLGPRKEIVLALDWTEFDDDDQATLCAYLITTHGRATPLMWQTVPKSELSDGRRTQAEHALILRLNEALPHTVDITLLADRGFGDQVLYEILSGWGWDFVIRFRGNILVEHQGVQRPAKDWLLPTRRARKLRAARVTADRTPVGAVVCVWDRRMKEPWFLATSHADALATQIVRRYGRRFCIEETFRDQKDLHFGMGLRATHIHDPQRRDRLLLLAALAQALLTLLGAAAEECGLDRLLKVNTAKKRTHSLFRQGLYWYGALPTAREQWLRPLLDAFDRLVRQHAVFQQVYAVI